MTTSGATRLNSCKRRLANPQLLAWYNTVQNSELFTSVLVIGEIRRGIEFKRPTNPGFAAKLERWLRWIQQDFQDRILPVTQEIAEVWGTLSPTRPLALGRTRRANSRNRDAP